MCLTCLYKFVFFLFLGFSVFEWHFRVSVCASGFPVASNRSFFSYMGTFNFKVAFLLFLCSFSMGFLWIFHSGPMLDFL